MKETYSDGKNASHIFEIKTWLWQTKQLEREVTDYYLEMTNLWQELDLSLDEEWDCPGYSILYKKRVENELLFEFLASLNRKLDEVRGRILGR